MDNTPVTLSGSGARRAERRIAALVLLDGVQVSVLLTVLPFVLLSGVGTAAEGLSAIGPLSGGIAGGVLGTVCIGRLVDRRAPYAVLQLLQGAQAILGIGVMVCSLGDIPVALAPCVAAAVALARSAGPAKDKIRSQHILWERRTAFNARVRRWFLVLNQVTVTILTLLLSLIPAESWPLLLILGLAAILASVLVTATLRRALPECPGPPAPARVCGERRPIADCAVVLVIVGVLGLGAAFGTVGLTAWVTATGHPPWFVAVAGAVVLAVDFWFIGFLSRLIESTPERWPTLHRWGAALLVLSILGAWAGTSLVEDRWSLPLVLISVTLAALALSVATMLALEVQFGYAEERYRGRISALTRVSAVGGFALATALAPPVFLGQVPVVLGLTATVCLLFVIPADCLRRALNADAPVP